MTTAEVEASQVPDNVASQIVLPEGHRDEVSLYEAYRWLRENAPVAHVEGGFSAWKKAGLDVEEVKPKG